MRSATSCLGPYLDGWNARPKSTPKRETLRSEPQVCRGPSIAHGGATGFWTITSGCRRLRPAWKIGRSRARDVRATKAEPEEAGSRRAFATTLAHPNPSDIVAGRDIDPVSTAVVASFGSWSSKPFAATVPIGFSPAV